MAVYADGMFEGCTWYLAHEHDKQAHEYLLGLVGEMRRRQSTLLDNTRKCISMFQFGGDCRNLDDTQEPPLEEAALTYNAAQNAIETVHSKVMKAQIAPMPLTMGGGYLSRHRAKQLGKAIEGVLEENHGDEVENDVVMDALVTSHGAGAAKVFERAGRVVVEHVPIEDLWFDEAEVRRRKPRCAFHIPADGVDKFVALEEWARDGDDYPGLVGTVAERRAAILKASTRGTATWRATSGSPAAAHRIDVYEAWHLPSGPVEYEEGEDGERKAKHDGRHVVCVEGATLIDEPWDSDRFPFVLYVPRKRRRHILGLSLMTALVPSQREYEKLTKKIQHAHQKLGMSGLIAHKDAKINVREFEAGTYGAGFVAEYEGQMPPVPFVPEPVAQGTYAYAESVPRHMLERNGISTLSASSQLPSGLQQASGKALQVFEDFESERLMPYHRERERFKVALSWLIVETARRIVDRGDSLKTKTQGKKGLESVDWKEVLLDRDDFEIRVFPVSELAKHPSAKFAQLTELLNAGAITVEQFRRLYGLPDLEAENDLDAADTDVIDMALELIVVKGKYVSPEGFDNLDLAIQRAGKFYNLCRVREVPDDRLRAIQDWIADATHLKQLAIDEANAAAAAAAPPPMPGAPLDGGGMALPEGPLPGMEVPPGQIPPMAA